MHVRALRINAGKVNDDVAFLGEELGAELFDFLDVAGAGGGEFQNESVKRRQKPCPFLLMPEKYFPRTPMGLRIEARR
jgi:hypothetical protein